MLTGDTLFVGDIARPDLAVDKDEGARGIFHSLHEQLLALPDDDARSGPATSAARCAAGPGMDMKVSSTIGYERAPQRAAARSTDEDEFVARATAGAAPAAAELPGDRRAQPRPAA